MSNQHNSKTIHLGVTFPWSKNLFIIFISAFLFSGCTTPSIKKEVPSAITVKVTNKNTFNVNESTSVEKLKGKPSVIVFGGTYCPHCVKAIPVFKTQIADVYSDQANIWVNVIDKKEFEANLPQGFNPNFTFAGLAKEKCAYVPSWIVLDADTNPVLSSCGGKKSMEEMETALKSVL